MTDVKIFQFPHSTCGVIGQYALCGKENLIIREYKYLSVRICGEGKLWE